MIKQPNQISTANVRLIVKENNNIFTTKSQKGKNQSNLKKAIFYNREDSIQTANSCGKKRKIEELVFKEERIIKKKKIVRTTIHDFVVLYYLCVGKNPAPRLYNDFRVYAPIRNNPFLDWEYDSFVECYEFLVKILKSEILV